MPSSTVSVQMVVDDALRFADIKPVISSSGSSMEPALTICNLVMAEMCSKKYDFKFNGFNVPVFNTISWQNDYTVLGITKLGWIQSGVAIDINSSQIPKRKYKLEVVRDLSPTSEAFGRPFQICWLPNANLQYGTWGTGLTVPNTNNTGQTNPGPNVVYTQPLGATVAPSNPITQITDPNGNLQLLTTFGVCGATAPSWPATKAAVGTTTADGTCVWTVIDPYGQGFRLGHIPAQAGTVWQIILRGQFKPVRFTSFSQFIDPLPDDYAHYFMQGFRAYCYQRSPEDKIRAKFQAEYALWQKSIIDAADQDSREVDSWGAYPSDSLMGDYDYQWAGPANPFSPSY